MARPRTCECGECRKCRHREYARQWRAKKTPAYVALLEREAAKARQRRLDDPDRYRMKSREQYAKHRDRRSESIKQYADEHPDRKRAHYAVKYALQTGRIEREPCSECGAEPAEAHHDDYTKPLEVQWLCRRHHSQIHRSLS